MQTRPGTIAAHNADHDPLLPEARSERFSRKTGARGIKKHEIRFRQFNLDPRNLRKPSRKFSGIFVVVRQPLDVMVQRIKARRSADSGLPQGSAEALLPAPRGI